MKKRRLSWRVCPECKGRATKIISLTTGLIECQQCGHYYPIPDPPTKEGTN